MAYGTPVHNQNKGYASQEKKDLMNDNPIAKDASGGRSWMSQHSKSGFGSSPLNQEETYAERKARLKKEGKAEMARLAKVDAARKARDAADAQKPKPKQQTKLQALKAKVISDLTGKTTDKPRSQS
tara:strand:+ start:258 stop:635 length:378 start_codon:yes stop_codon:yes gene_type:complete